MKYLKSFLESFSNDDWAKMDKISEDDWDKIVQKIGDSILHTLDKYSIKESQPPSDARNYTTDPWKKTIYYLDYEDMKVCIDHIWGEDNFKNILEDIKASIPSIEKRLKSIYGFKRKVTINAGSSEYEDYVDEEDDWGEYESANIPNKTWWISIYPGGEGGVNYTEE